MLATRERQHSGRLPYIKKYRFKVLPIAAVYGGNASGKTNLFKALNFAKNYIVKGLPMDATIPVMPFMLDDSSAAGAVAFYFDILVDELIYSYSFTANLESVIEERMAVTNSVAEKLIYHRHDGIIELGTDVTESDNELARINFVFEGTRDNQLFLTNTVSQKVTIFKNVYDWFAKTLSLIAPDSRFQSFESFIESGSPMHDEINRYLRLLDTGIERLGGEDIEFDSLPEPLKKLNEDMTVGMAARVWGRGRDRIIISRDREGFKAKKLITYHKNNKGEDVLFSYAMESDGSCRLINLLPAFLELTASNVPRVFVIDEIDRSMHTLLTRKLISYYLDGCSQASRNQLLMTTHDVLLIDQKLLRRDEMWVTERNFRGESSLTSFSEYKDVRYDKDIRASYLDGRLGGVPKLLLSDCMIEKPKA
ncbi:MAG: ATP-binding protein [Synergistaceae bacterium]|nr:ATP-binding protein [Synergistaceae bacterium]